jgi:hypothetical protein
MSNKPKEKARKVFHKELMKYIELGYHVSNFEDRNGTFSVDLYVEHQVNAGDPLLKLHSKLKEHYKVGE